MLINFIGCPQSGKTTIAAMLFASMKETGMVAEFNPEQARFYIAKLRVKKGLRPDDVVLTDEDQFQIMKAQVEADEIFVKACGERVFIVSDSSPLNSMLYMTPEFRKEPKVQVLVERSMALKSLTFHMYPIYRPYLEDPNRIHGEQQSREIDSRIPGLLQVVQDLQVTPVDGTVSERLLLVQNRIHFA